METRREKGQAEARLELEIGTEQQYLEHLKEGAIVRTKQHTANSFSEPSIKVRPMRAV